MSKTTLGILYCVAGALSWGFSGACVEALFKNYIIDPLWVTSARMTVTGALLCLWLAMQPSKYNLLEPLRDKQSLKELLVFAIGGLLLCQFAYLSAIRYSNAGTATVLQSLEVVVVAVYVCITTHTAPSKRVQLSVLLALVGVWLLATGGDFGSMRLTTLGLIWGLIDAVSGATYSLSARAPVQRWGSLRVTGLGMLIGGTAMLVLSQSWYIPAGMDLRGWLLVGVIALLGTLGAFVLFLEGIRLVGAVKASVLACLEAVFASLLSAVWLGSSFSATDLVGFAMILATVFLLRE